MIYGKAFNGLKKMGYMLKIIDFMIHLQHEHHVMRVINLMTPDTHNNSYTSKPMQGKNIRKSFTLNFWNSFTLGYYLLK